MKKYRPSVEAPTAFDLNSGEVSNIIIKYPTSKFTCPFTAAVRNFVMFQELMSVRRGGKGLSELDDTVNHAFRMAREMFATVST